MYIINTNLNNNCKSNKVRRSVTKTTNKVVNNGEIKNFKIVYHFFINNVEKIFEFELEFDEIKLNCKYADEKFVENGIPKIDDCIYFIKKNFNDLDAEVIIGYALEYKAFITILGAIAEAYNLYMIKYITNIK